MLPNTTRNSARWNQGSSLLLSNKAPRRAGGRDKRWLGLAQAAPAHAKEVGRERGREARMVVPCGPGTEGSYKACSSNGPSRQAGFIQRVSGDSLAAPRAHAKGARRWELSQLPCAPLGYRNSPNNVGKTGTRGISGKGDTEQEESRAAVFIRSCGGRLGRRERRREGDRGEGGSLGHQNPWLKANGESPEDPIRAFTDASCGRRLPPPARVWTRPSALTGADAGAHKRSDFQGCPGLRKPKPP